MGKGKEVLADDQARVATNAASPDVARAAAGLIKLLIKRSGVPATLEPARPYKGVPTAAAVVPNCGSSPP